MHLTRIAAAAALFSLAVPAAQADLNSAVALTAANRLITFSIAGTDPIGGPGFPVKNLAAGERVAGIDHRPATGRLYGLTTSGRVLLLRSNGFVDSSVALNVGLNGTAFGVDFNPVPDRLRIVSTTGQDLRANVDTGATLVDGALNPGVVRVAAAAYTNSARGAGTTTLYTIDVVSNTLNIQDPPNAGTQIPVGPLGVDVTQVTGFDIRGSDNLALAALEVNGQSGLYRINLATGAATFLRAFAPGIRVTGLSIPAPQVEAFGVTERNTLVRFDLPAFTTAPVAPLRLRSVGAVSGLAPGESLVGLDFRPANGQLVGLGSTGTFYLINPNSGAASGPVPLVANGTDNIDRNADYAGLMGEEFGVDFNPVPDALRTVSDSTQNLRSNVVSGATFTDSVLKGFSATAAAYTNSLTGTITATRLFVLDSARGVLTLQNPPNNGTLVDIGPLGVATSGVSGFDIVGADDLTTPANVIALAALIPAGSTASSLYSINVGTGAATLVGPIAGSALIGLALPPTPTPAADSTVFGLRSDGRTLVSFPRNAPGVVTTVASIPSTADLLAADRFIGIDFRPATGLLFGITTANEVFTIDTATGAATLAATLTAATGNDAMGNPLDPTPDFAGLYGTNYGFDFNPVPDRLRVVSDAALNLRINVTTGGTITDGDINSATAPVPQIVAAAYTNMFPGGAAAGGTVAAATTLYVIDTASDTLGIQNPPNSGVIAPVGPLGVAVPTSGVSFDIVGGANGLAFGSWDSTGDGRAELYRINLTTGAATLVGDVGLAPGPTVESLTIRLQ